MRSYGKILDLLIVFILLQAIPQLSGFLANNTAKLIANIDPAGVFLWVSLHHIYQLLFTLFVMFVWYRKSFRDWGLNLNNYRYSLEQFGWFCLYFTLSVTVIQILPMIITKSYPSFNYFLNIRNVSGHLGFLFLLSGTCEEPLFRGLVMTVLYQSWKGDIQIGKFKISIAGLLATVLFVFAHVGINYRTWEITQFSIPQLLISLVLGLYYAIIFDRTRSLVGPILAHNYSNGIIYALIYGAIFLIS